MALTEEQEKAIKHDGSPLFIQAGAGTGKTFTLTKRIAFGLSEASGPLIESVDRLLTITFTNKAAAELIGRVRAELRAQGLLDESLEVDAAWISTIHSMGRRILFAHAFEMNVDPGANLLMEEESRALSALALDVMLQELADDERIKLLVETFDTEKALKLIQDVSELFAVAPGGAADFDFGPRPRKADKQLVDGLIALFMQTLSEIEEIGPCDKPNFLENLDSLKVATEWLQKWHEDTASPDWRAIEKVLSACPKPKKKSIGAPYRELFTRCRDAFDDLTATAQDAVSYALIVAASELAVEHLSRYAQLKRERGMLDTSDLLIGTYRLFQDKAIAKEYSDKFQSVMIDEFQDTDSLQVEIARQLCKEGLSTLTTVGDAQQSIYGFRGADLEVFQDMRRTMHEHDSVEAKLDVNHRSHEQVLNFVEDVFSKPELFGGEFLKVSASSNRKTDSRWLKLSGPRVKVLMSAGLKTEGRGHGTKVDYLRRADAKALARELESLHGSDGKGASYGDMAILVSSTKGDGARSIIKELRRRGIPCIVSGGSDFFKHPEVKIVSMFLRVLADRDDDEALYELLASDFFDLRDDDLLELANVAKYQLHIFSEESRAKSSLFDALGKLASDQTCEDEGAPKKRYGYVLDVLEQALSSVQTMPLSQVMRNAVEASGWKQTLALRGVEGGAVFANVERACDWIEDFEALYGHRVFAASQYLRRLIESAEDGAEVRAKPGSLISTGQDAVRIMTIHSSKGLEFPIVAVADFDREYKAKKTEVISLTENGRRFLALGTSSKSGGEDLLFSQSLSTAPSYGRYLAHARALHHQRSLEESQRLLYVALTRAREMLVLVAHDSKYGSGHVLSGGLTKTALEAAFDGDVPSQNGKVITGTGALVDFAITEVPPEQPLEDVEIDEASLQVEHAYPPHEAKPEISSFAQAQPDIYSYSSLARRAKEVAKPVAQAIALPDRSQRSDTASTVGSAFHLVAEWLAMNPESQPGALEGRLEAAGTHYDLDDEERQRLRAAVDAWLASERLAQARSFEQRRAEYPFCVDIEGIALEGYIDLVCWNDGGDALIVDYKTGVSGEGDELRERYALQAACYAYALLSTGFSSRVELAFVRPEAGMEEVRFDFGVDDLLSLKAQILG